MHELQVRHKKRSSGKFIRYLQNKMGHFAWRKPGMTSPDDKSRRLPWIGIVLGIGLMGGALYLLSR